jgi:SAM-dependent methyltransferase
MTDAKVLVDAHVHVHPDTDLALLLDSAAANFTKAARKAGIHRWHGVLLLAEMRDTHWFDSIPPEGLEAGAWRVQRRPGDELAVDAQGAGVSILIVPGRQIVTQEGIEVLASGTSARIPDGLTLAETLQVCRQQAALTTLPWAVGKWLGRRGALVADALNRQTVPVHGGDNGGRPWFWPRPRQWLESQRQGLAVLSGSDPLPLPGDERRVGSFGSAFSGALPPGATGRDLLERLRRLKASEVHHFGALQGAVQFFRNQVGLRLKKKKHPRAVAAPMSTETPDVETSSAGYARRFSGPAGRYLLGVQSRSVREALRGLPPGKALDVGGGHGQLVDLLRELGWEVTVQGSTAECGRNLRELHGKKDCPFRESDIFSLPAADGEYDLVIAVRLISHVEDWPRLVREMCRASRGAVVIDYPAKSALNVLTPLLFGLKKSLEGNTRTYTSFSGAQLGEEFSRHGFARPRSIKQFFMPMVVHRVGKGAAPLRAAEAVFRALGLTALFGSPVILRVDRQ